MSVPITRQLTWSIRETDKDDILVRDANQEEHNKQLTAALTRCEEIKLTFNKDKCRFNFPKVSYIEHALNSEGVKPDPKKVKDMPPPTDKKGRERALNWHHKLSYQICTHSN